MTKSILITGGLGFIGSHLVEALTQEDCSLSIFDNYSVAKPYSFSNQVKIYKQDISDPAIVNLIKKIKPEVIIHLAADNRVTALPADVIKSNVVGTYNLLTAAREAKINQFIFSSSAAVYGNPETLPIKEAHPKKPLSAYGLSKLVDELYLEQFRPFFSTSVFRFANVYGPRQSSQSEGGVVSIFIDRLLKRERPIIYGNGQQTRDFVYVGDIVRALILAIKASQSFTLNIGTNQPVSVLNLINQICQLINTKPVFEKKPFRPIEIKDSLFDYSQAKKTIGWEPKTSLTEGLIQTINYFKSL